MEINVRDDMKLVTIWLTRAEQEDTALRERLKTLYAEYKAKKNMVAQFHSGTEDLYQGTRDLLIFNRKRIEEIALQREKQTAGPDHSCRRHVQRVRKLRRLLSLQRQALQRQIHPVLV